jgi:hypothetical protein
MPEADVLGAGRRAQGAGLGSGAPRRHKLSDNASDSGGDPKPPMPDVKAELRELRREIDRRVGELSDRVDRAGGARDRAASALINAWDTACVPLAELVEEPGWAESGAELPEQAPPRKT